MALQEHLPVFPEQPPVLIRRIGRGRGSWGLPSRHQSETRVNLVVVPAGFLSQRRLAPVPRGPVRASPLPTPFTLNQRSAGDPHPESLQATSYKEATRLFLLGVATHTLNTPSPSQALHTGAHTHSEGGFRPRWGGATVLRYRGQTTVKCLEPKLYG